MTNLGIDIGSTTTKGVILSNDGLLLNSLITPTGSSPVLAASNLIAELSKECTPSKIYATGYGRGLVSNADKRITEITCHGAGVNSIYQDACAIIDIGGQDSKAIHLGNDGSVVDFAMNDKCAAGTGSFLDNIAHKFNISYDSMLDLYLSSDKRVNINSTCVVFAESEIIGLLAKGESMSNIFKGVLRAISMRISRLYSQVKIPHESSKVYFTGGVAKNIAMQEALKEELNAEIIVDSNAQFMGAIGAAHLARRDTIKER